MQGLPFFKGRYTNERVRVGPRGGSSLKSNTHSRYQRTRSFWSATVPVNEFEFAIKRQAVSHADVVQLRLCVKLNEISGD